MSTAVSAANIPGLLAPAQEFLVHNAGDNEIIGRFDAQQVAIPPISKVIFPDPKNPDKFHSGKDTEGNWIPGSLVVRDIIGERVCSGHVAQRWEAAAAIRHILGVDPTAKTMSGPYWEAGISILPLHPTPELVEQVAVEGRKRYEVFQLEQDRNLVAAYNEAAAKIRQFGLIPQSPPARYYQATKRLETAEQQGFRAFTRDDDDLKQRAIEKAMELAKEAAASLPKGASVDTDELVKRLLADEVFQKQVMDSVGFRLKRFKAEDRKSAKEQEPQPEA